jgi:hypothetical protein
MKDDLFYAEVLVKRTRLGEDKYSLPDRECGNLFEDLKELGSAIENGDAQLIADRWISVKKGLGL